MLIDMVQGDDPGEMTFKIIDGKIEMTLKGDMYNQYCQDASKGVYKVDLKAYQLGIGNKYIQCKPQQEFTILEGIKVYELVKAKSDHVVKQQ